MPQEYYINGTNPELEKDLLTLFAKFCFKSEPLPIFGEGRTVSQKFSAIYRYFDENFKDGICFYEANKAFVMYQEGQKWLDNEIPEFYGKKVAVMIMGASLNNDMEEMIWCVRAVKESLTKLKEQYNFDVVAWNINRVRNKKPFERIMKILGGKKLRDCYYV